MARVAQRCATSRYATSAAPRPLLRSSNLYACAGEDYVKHRTIHEATGEYARRKGDVVVHSNTMVSVSAVLKRGMIGVYQHCGEAYLHRYLAEFDFRYNRRAALKVTDSKRHNQLLAMIEAKRLTYRRIGETRDA